MHWATSIYPNPIRQYDISIIYPSTKEDPKALHPVLAVDEYFSDMPALEEQELDEDVEDVEEVMEEDEVDIEVLNKLFMDTDSVSEFEGF